MGRRAATLSGSISTKFKRNKRGVKNRGHCIQAHESTPGITPTAFSQSSDFRSGKVAVAADFGAVVNHFLIFFRQN
jgi:hypothetical protein